MTAQSWTISSSTAFTYQLAADTTTTCSFTPTVWLVTTTSTANAGSVSDFQYISNTGEFSAGPFSDYTKAGIYNVSVTSVVLNAVTYLTTNTVASPNSFLLTVIDPCAAATVTASSVAPISVLAYQASAAYSPFTGFTYVATDLGTTNCGTFTYTATLALGSALNPLTTFSLNSLTSDFQVYSGDLN